MNITEALRWGRDQLLTLDNPYLEAEVLLMAILGKDRAFVKTHDHFQIDLDDLTLYKKFVQQRAQDLPLAYVLGYKIWKGLKIEVNEYTLIPRDETELLVDYALESLENVDRRSREISILDVGTGSGCMALAMASALVCKDQKLKILGVDISDQALEVARCNAQAWNTQNSELALAVDLCFMKSDLLNGIKKGEHWDVIVANLPYVPEDMAVSPQVQKEPYGAIFSGVDGLDHYRRFCRQLTDQCLDFKSVWIEFLPSQKAALADIFQVYRITWFGDLEGAIRFAQIKP